MSPSALVLPLVRSSLSAPFGPACAIILAVFIQEDVTTVTVGMMAAEHLVPVPLAIVSLMIGAILNDLGLYGIGRLAITHRGLHRWVTHEKRLPLRSWLGDHLVSTVVTTQFLPGMRLPIYAACGFFALPFLRFAGAVVGVVIVWSPLLFAAAYFYGEYTLAWFGFWRWPIALAAVMMLAFAGRSHWKSMTKAGHTVQAE
jgi:membrane protein DedA with SNARE-associated domain